ncbi:MAG: PCMD domain-containing protein [Parabacteroides sp.]|nr:PCMD domain-containing protein [Parabacteroides sp.]MDD7560999.1 PCMD domain-containing protein [Parabacteroides sp.]MDY5623566.1 PCMD domain-containing protein [Bacteroidales bacterium]
MKKLYHSLVVLASIFVLGSCQNDDWEHANVGYLNIEVGTDKTTITKAEEVYNPKQIAVKIIDETGKTVKETDDYTTWTGAIALTPGKYKISASSAGFDGTTAAWDKPYYAGLDSVTIVKGESVSKTVTCTLANVLVTVEFDSEFKKAFKSATVVVTDTVTASNKVTFTMNETTEKGKAYFPVTGLFADLAVTNQKDKIFSKKDTVEDVKARENVILRYKLGESSTGSTNIDITLDGTTKTYIYTIGVPLTATSTIVASGANAWSSFAYLNAEIPSFAGIFDSSKLYFEYKTAEALEWMKVETEKTVIEKDKKYSIKLSGLTPGTAYQYRAFYDDGSENGIVSDVVDFMTEVLESLPNGNLDNWYKSNKTWYPVSESDYNISGSFWDSSNPGTTTGAGALVNKNPTQGNSITVHTSGGQSAELKSQYASAFGIGKFAAASLYTGKFNSLVGTNGAKIDFGQKFVSRPTALHGWFHYNSGKIDYRGGNTPAGLGEKGTDDLCSIYVALSKKQKQVDNTNTSTFLDLEKDTDIIAYGRLDDTEAVTTNGWKEFTLDFKYKTLEPLDTYYLIIVFSASKYGDYFTGSTGSVMYVDDLELIYGDEPVLSE